MPALEVISGSVELDDEGCLVDFGKWSPQVAGILAERAGIPELSVQHMQVLDVIRKYYQRFGVARE